MSKLFLILLLVNALTAHAGEPVRRDGIHGDWLGGYEKDGDWVQIGLHVPTNATSSSATMDAPALNWVAMPVDSIVCEGSAVRFHLAGGGTEITFSGQAEADRIEGTMMSGQKRHRLVLMRSVALNGSALADYEGSYEWDKDHCIYIQRWDELGKDQLVAFDESGRIRALYSMGGDRFFVGGGVAVPVPLEATIAFQRDGNERAVESLSWQPVQGDARRARRVKSATEEDVMFSNNGIQLAGTIITPFGKGPYPAIVVVHGSGAQSRNGSLPFVRFLVRHGIALLSYDKRGVGASGGDWKKSSFEDLAGDARAAIRFLETRADIDPRKIGIFGISQGGWIGPLAASMSNDVAFVISVAGPGVTPAEETLDFMQNEMRLAGMSGQDIDDARRFAQLGFDYARTEKGWEKYLAAYREASAKDWFPFMGMSDQKSDWQWELRRLTNDYDPAIALKKLRCPILAFFGGRDSNVLPVKNFSKWNETLQDGMGVDYTFVLLGKGNHIMMKARTGSVFELPYLSTMLADYSGFMLEWLRIRLAD